MVDEKDLEIARLRGQLEGLSLTKRPRKKPPSSAWAWIVVIAIGAVLAYAWNRGKALAERDEAIESACAVASESENERTSCIRRMDDGYIGTLNPERTANAAAEQVRQMREDGWR